MKDSSDFMNEIISQRTEEICNEISTSEWYKTLQDEAINKRKVLKSLLSKEDIKLLDGYDNVCIEIHCKTAIAFYKIAYNDGYYANNMTPQMTPK